MNLSIQLLNNAVLLREEVVAGPARVIIGGNDGVLITIGPDGHIHVTPPGGPGDPEVRQATASIVSAAQVLSRLGAAQGAIRGAGA